ncbi:UNVERIFIED_CONTAM: hypothetical protein Slati_3654500 [Sesamum latifolium]|uniref:Uncharacterized protein n=1 Tax=Sesamum latifolium TaxID=2727402 RepID=A0AAW2U1G8_9LAMI
MPTTLSQTCHPKTSLDYSLLKIPLSLHIAAVQKDSERIDKEGNACETKKPPVIDTDHCKPALVESSNSNMERKSGVSPTLEAVRDYKHLLPAHDGLPISPKAEHATFQFQLQEADQKVKRSMMSWKLIKNKEIASLIRRGKQILA